MVPCRCPESQIITVSIVKAPRTKAFVARSHDPQVFWLLALAVAPDYRRQGVGVGLTRAAINVAIAAEARRLLLTVHPENQAALAVYHSLGFEAGKLQADYFGFGRPRLLMHLDTADITPKSIS